MLIGQVTVGLLIPDSNEEPSYVMKLAITGVYSIITIGGGVLLFKLIYKHSIRHIGLIRSGLAKWNLCGILIGVLLIGAMFAILNLSGAIHINNIQWSKFLSSFIVVELVSLGFTAFSEEFLLRGFIITALKTTRNKWMDYQSSGIIWYT